LSGATPSPIRLMWRPDQAWDPDLMHIYDFQPAPVPYAAQTAKSDSGTIPAHFLLSLFY